MKVLITGATGFIGSALAKRLTQLGCDVVGVSRFPEQQQPSPRMSWCSPDRIPEVDVVYHLAGESVLGLWTEGKKKRIYESRVEGTRRLVEQILASKGKPLLFVSASAVGYYGGRGDEILDEASASGPQNGFLTRVCRDWEKESEKLTQFGIRTVHARLGLVMSSGAGMLSLQWPLFKRRVCMIPSEPDFYMPWVSLEDVVDALIYAGETPSIEGPLNITAPVPIKVSKWVSDLNDLFRFRVQCFIPAWVMKFLGKEFCEESYVSQRVVPKKLLDSGYLFKDHTWSEFLKKEWSKK